MIHVRSYDSADQEFILSLAPRLAIGIAPWRNPQKMIGTVQGWITESIQQHGKKSMVFVAEDLHGERLGFATVSHSAHFTGDGQAYIGELATNETAEGHGVGKALAQACEQWARDQGFRFISLATGAANERALGFYRHMGYLDEDVTLVKLLYQVGTKLVIMNGSCPPSLWNVRRQESLLRKSSVFNVPSLPRTF